MDKKFILGMLWMLLCIWLGFYVAHRFGMEPWSWYALPYYATCVVIWFIGFAVIHCNE